MNPQSARDNPRIGFVMQVGEEHIFDAGVVRRLVERARGAIQISGDGPQGWAISEVDPGLIVEAFAPALHLRAGLSLRAYQFRSGGNGNGVVFAVPKGIALAPSPTRKGNGFSAPARPPDALDHFMDAIAGDGTPWSFLCASLLARELFEFGALWHGANWGTHTLIGTAPWLERASDLASDEAVLSAGPDGWSSDLGAPGRLDPNVRVQGVDAVVTFHTYSALVQARVVRHVDRYSAGSLRPESSSQDIALGPGGFIF